MQPAFRMCLFTIAACGARPPVSPGDPALAAKVEAYLAPYVAMHDFAGTVLIARGDRVLVQRTFGDAPAGAPYAVGSIAKTVTAAAIELLAARGKLQLADPIGHYVSGLPYGDTVTLQQLLDHRAGVPDLYGFPELAAARSKDISLRDLVALIATKPLDFAPGSDERYSNSGYALLAAAIERVAGTPYGAFVAHELLAPLHLSHSGDLTSGAPRDLAPGRDPGFPPTFVTPAAPLGTGWLIGSGSLYATADDLLRWIHAVRAGALVAAPQLYGWGTHDHNGTKLLEQDGRISGYAAYVGATLDDDIVVIALSNIQTQAVNQLGPDLVAIARGTKIAPPPLRPVSTDLELAHFVGRYQVAPDFVMTIAATPHGLTLAGPDGVPIALDREGATAFYFRPLSTEIQFTVAGGAATALVWGGSAFPRI